MISRSGEGLGGTSSTSLHHFTAAESRRKESGGSRIERCGELWFPARHCQPPAFCHAPSMRTLLDFNGEKWRRNNCCSGITLFVQHSPHPFVGDRLIHAHMELEFIPAWFTSED